METVQSEYKCSVCEEREQHQRREDAAIVRRTDAAHAAALFRKRRTLSRCLEAAERVADMTGAAELKLIPTVICRAGLELDSEIERLADDMPEEHADLAEGIRLLHSLVQQGGDAKYDDGVFLDGQQQEQVVITAKPHILDAETWQQLFERRDVLAMLADGSPPPQPEPDGIPF